jgi:hypothetical protein
MTASLAGGLKAAAPKQRLTGRRWKSFRSPDLARSRIDRRRQVIKHHHVTNDRNGQEHRLGPMGVNKWPIKTSSRPF